MSMLRASTLMRFLLNNEFVRNALSTSLSKLHLLNILFISFLPTDLFIIHFIIIHVT